MAPRLRSGHRRIRRRSPAPRPESRGRGHASRAATACRRAGNANAASIDWAGRDGHGSSAAEPQAAKSAAPEAASSAAAPHATAPAAEAASRRARGRRVTLGEFSRGAAAAASARPTAIASAQPSATPAEIATVAPEAIVGIESGTAATPQVGAPDGEAVAVIPPPSTALEPVDPDGRIDALLKGLKCARVESEYALRGGNVELSGHVKTDADLADLLAQIEAIPGVEDDQRRQPLYRRRALLRCVDAARARRSLARAAWGYQRDRKSGAGRSDAC